MDYLFLSHVLSILSYNSNMKKAKAELSMSDRTIERIEEKFLLTRQQKTALIKAIKKQLNHDEFYKEEVLSLYLDTDNYDLAVKSLDKPDFRIKVRVRSYNVPTRSKRVFFEVKTKLKVDNRRVGNKRRLVIPLKDFYAYIEKGADLEKIAEKASKGDAQQIQVARELDYMVKHYKLKPQLLIVSDRTAYSGKDDKGFRLTFDENLRFRTTKLKLEKGGDGEKYFPNTADPKHSIIMEVKTMNAMPPWFVAELNKLHTYPIRFSKYGKIYQLIIKRKEKNV